jgi:hypothetical protein
VSKFYLFQPFYTAKTVRKYSNEFMNIGVDAAAQEWQAGWLASE